MKFKIYIYLYLLYFTAFYNIILELIPNSDALASASLFHVDGLIIILGLFSIKKSYNKSSLLGLSLLLFWSTAALIMSSNNWISHFNGLRELLVMVLIFPIMEEINRSNLLFWFNNKIKVFVKVFLYLQLPVAALQFIKYGAGDHVGGTLGFGYSGILTFLVLLMVYFRIYQGLEKQGMKVYLNLIFLLPLFLNETKISFILIPLLFLSLTNFKKAASALFAPILGCLFFLLLNLYYTDEGKSYDNNTASELFSQDFLEYYLVGDDLSQYNDIPRFSKLILGVGLVTKDTFKSFFGIEYGAFKGGKTVNKSRFSKEYDWLLKGSIPFLFYLIISGGFGLTLLILYNFFYNLLKGPYQNRKLQMLLISIFIIVIFYNEAPRIQVFMLLFVYFIFYAKYGGFDKTPAYKQFLNEGITDQ